MSILPIYRYSNVLPDELFLLLQSCHHTINKEEQSYWIEAEGKDDPKDIPSSSLFLIEQIISYIYTNVMKIQIPNLKGIEWWVHVRSPVDSMFMHFDRDEGQWARSNDGTPAQFPIFSSVFFLSSIGQPLILVDQRPNNSFTCLIPPIPLGGYKVDPISNSLVIFPGSWLHGIERPSSQQIHSFQPLSPRQMNCFNSRITLLMNFWCTPLEDPTCVTFSLEQRQLSDLRERFGKNFDITSYLANKKNKEDQVQKSSLTPLNGKNITKLYEFDLQQYQTRGAEIY